MHACSDVKRHYTNAENMSHKHDNNHESRVSSDRLSAQPCSSSGVMHIVLPDNRDTVVIRKNGHDITVTIA